MHTAGCNMAGCIPRNGEIRITNTFAIVSSGIPDVPFADAGPPAYIPEGTGAYLEQAIRQRCGLLL
jgi:hypothetical protein